MIAEPWDLGDGGYQVGNFPSLWSEWNGKYRDGVRQFWKGDGAHVNEFATRLCGSSDLYEWSSRRPYASINFITCHDGFTLNDLVSYNDKHNEANSEENRDGSNNNISWNCGAEGPTDNPDITATRDRQVRNFLATLLLSQGVPMLLAGDEIGHTQNGNNNAYCHDNELTWLNWKLDERQAALLRFTQSVIALRKINPVFQRQKFFQGRSIRGQDTCDIAWYAEDGKHLDDQAWNGTSMRCLGLYLDGDMIGEADSHGDPVHGESILLLLNSHHEQVQFQLPSIAEGTTWKPLLDTNALPDGAERVGAGTPYRLEGRSLAVLRLVPTAKAAETRRRADLRGLRGHRQRAALAGRQATDDIFGWQHDEQAVRNDGADNVGNSDWALNLRSDLIKSIFLKNRLFGQNSYVSVFKIVLAESILSFVLRRVTTCQKSTLR